MSELEERISQRFLEYQYLRNEKAYRSAMIGLAEIHHCLPKLDETERTIWTQRLDQEALSDEFIQAARDGLEEDVQQIRRILSYGTRWNGEEIILFLTLRIEIELALSFLKDHLQTRVRLATEDIDEQIEEVAKTNENRRSFEIAIDLINQNWGLPINSKWMRKDSGN